MSAITPAQDLPKRVGLWGDGADKRRQQRLICRQPKSPLAESFHLLAANVETLLAESERRALVVVSPSPGDGRSLVAANLAIALAEEHRVLLIDEERRTLSGLFLSGETMRRDGIPPSLRRSVLETNQAGIYIKPGTEGETHVQYNLVKTIDVAEADGMYTIIDSPPASQSSEAFWLAQRAGSVLYVVRKDAVPMDVHREIRKHLERLNAKIIGLVLNEF
jgi:Mrp family chromosome partitioning ATPase